MFVFDPGTQEAIQKDVLSPEVRVVTASGLLITLDPSVVGNEEYWRAVLLSVPNSRFLQLAAGLYEERLSDQKKLGMLLEEKEQAVEDKNFDLATSLRDEADLLKQKIIDQKVI